MRTRIAGGVAIAAILSACGFHTSGELPPGAATSSGTSASTASSTSSGAGGASTTSSSAAGGAGGSTTATTSSSATGSGGATTGSGGATPGSGGGMDGGVVTYASCAERHAAQPADPSGVYDLVPAMGAAYQAFCDMEASSGGWTLALKIDGKAGTFSYDAALWTDTNALAPDKPDLDQNEAKLASYWSIPVTEIRLGMIDGGTTRWAELMVQGASLQALLAADAEIKTTRGNGFWEGLLADGSIQTKCNWEGLNADDRVRIGLVGDESGDCKSPDSVIGFGGKGGFGPASGNEAHWFPDHGDRSTKTFGYVLVR